MSRIPSVGEHLVPVNSPGRRCAIRVVLATLFCGATAALPLSAAPDDDHAAPKSSAKVASKSATPKTKTDTAVKRANTHTAPLATRPTDTTPRASAEPADATEAKPTAEGAEPDDETQAALDDIQREAERKKADQGDQKKLRKQAAKLNRRPNYIPSGPAKPLIRGRHIEGFGNMLSQPQAMRGGPPPPPMPGFMPPPPGWNGFMRPNNGLPPGWFGGP